VIDPEEQFRGEPKKQMPMVCIFGPLRSDDVVK
jgi:hypothetical protein